MFHSHVQSIAPNHEPSGGPSAVRSLLTLRPSPRLPGPIPVYRLVTRDQLLLARSELATDITGVRRPQ